MKERLFSQRLINVVGHFDANVSMSDELPKYIGSVSIEGKAGLEEEMLKIIENKTVTIGDIYQSTAFSPKSTALAQQFFEDIYKYAFKGGEEPDIDEYR